MGPQLYPCRGAPPLAVMAIFVQILRMKNLQRYSAVFWLVAFLGLSSGPSELLVLCIADGGHFEIEVAQPNGFCDDVSSEARLTTDCQRCSDLTYETDIWRPVGTSEHEAPITLSSLPVYDPPQTVVDRSLNSGVSLNNICPVSPPAATHIRTTVLIL